MTITYSAKPGHAHLHASKLLHRDLKVASTQVCTATLHQWLRANSCTMTQKWFHDSLYRDRSHTESNLYLDGKNTRRAFAHYGLGNLTIVARFDSTAFNRSATFTNYIAGPL
jgi:hypothetical protein